MKIKLTFEDDEKLIVFSGWSRTDNIEKSLYLANQILGSTEEEAEKRTKMFIELLK